MAERAITPVDLSDATLYTEDRWHEPFAQLRAQAPVSWREESPYGAYWSVVTHDLIQQVELDPATFSSQVGNITIVDSPTGREFPNFIAMDPPRHTEQRRVVAAAFTPSQMAKRERQVRERTKELFDALPIGQEIDWVGDVSIPLTIAMLAIVLDFPWDERMSLRKWSDMASNVTPEIMNEEYSAKFFAEMGLMLARFDALLEARRLQEPADDLLSRMIHSEAMGNLTPIERIANIALLIVGGNDTTRNSMSGFIDAFHRFPGELDRIRTNRELIPNAAQEIIRWQSPVTHMRRTCTRDVELGGQMLRAGEKVVLWYISANRDAQVFADPDRFDAGRDNARRHLGFGHGIHRCVGARLAEIQLGTVLEELADRNLTVTPLRAPSRLGSPFLHGFTAMPVRVEQS